MDGSIALTNRTQTALTSRAGSGMTTVIGRRGKRCTDTPAHSMHRTAGRDVPLPSVVRFLAGKAQIMALAEQRRAQQLVPVPVPIRI